jgi:hypothetical protein
LSPLFCAFGATAGYTYFGAGCSTSMAVPFFLTCVCFLAAGAVFLGGSSSSMEESSLSSSS